MGKKLCEEGANVQRGPLAPAVPAARGPPFALPQQLEERVAKLAGLLLRGCGADPALQNSSSESGTGCRAGCRCRPGFAELLRHWAAKLGTAAGVRHYLCASAAIQRCCHPEASSAQSPSVLETCFLFQNSGSGRRRRRDGHWLCQLAFLCVQINTTGNPWRGRN